MRKFRQLLLISCLGLSFITPTYAATAGGDSSGAIKAMEALLTYLNTLVGTTAKTLSELVYQVSPTTPATVTNNAQLVTADSDSATDVSGQTSTQVADLLSQNVQSQASAISSIVASDSLTAPSAASVPFWGSSSSKAFQQQQQQGDQNFNFDALIGPLQYTSNQASQAANFITTLNIMNLPYTSADLAANIGQLTDTQKQTLENMSDYQNYQTYIRGLASVQSIALTNLNQIYADRVAPQGGTSAAQMRYNTASWRIQDPDWMLEMAQASPAAVEREQTLIQAEILYRLNAIQDQMERQNAMTAALLLQSIQTTGKAQLATMEIQLSSDVDNIQQATTTNGDGQAEAQEAAQRLQQIQQ